MEISARRKVSRFAIILLSYCLVAITFLQLGRLLETRQPPMRDLRNSEIQEPQDNFKISRNQLSAFRAVADDSRRVYFTWDSTIPVAFASPSLATDLENWTDDSPVVGIDGDAWWTTDTTLEALSAFPSIRYVHLAYCCRISDRGIECLTRLPELKTLVLYRNQTKYAGNLLPDRVLDADVQLPQVLTDDALTYISQMKSLEYLYLNGNTFSEDAILNLGSLDTLRYLALDASQISEDGENQLRRRLPNCELDVSGRRHRHVDANRP